MNISGLTIAQLMAMIDKEEAQPLTIMAGSNRIGSIVLATEQDGEMKVLVVHALSCKPVEGVDISVDILAKVMVLADLADCDLVRCWTARHGLVEKMQKSGAKVRYILEFTTNGK